MSNITQYIMASHTCRASQTHERSDKSTHANLTVFTKAPTRLYGKYKLVHDFKDIHPDPEIDKLIDELGSLLDGALRGFYDPQEFQESDPMHMHFQAPIYPMKQIAGGRGVKRPFSDCKLETIFEAKFEHHEHRQDVGTDPMPTTCSSDKATQVSEREIMDFYITCKQTSPIRETIAPRCRLIPPSIKKPMFKVFVTFADGIRRNSASDRKTDPWVLAGPDMLLQRRPVLASSDGAHPDALLRLKKLNRYVVSVPSALNSGRLLLTYNEFPFTRAIGVRTFRFHTGMIRRGSIIGIGAEILSQTEIDRYIRENQNLPRIENPFESVVRPRRFMNEPDSATHSTPPFWHRLGICVPIPRVWRFIRQTSPFPRNMSTFHRILGERS